MSTQDRNMDRNSAVIQKELTSGPFATIAVNDKDVTELIFKPRHNFRLLDLMFSCKAVGVAAASVRCGIAKELEVIGAPQFAAGVGVTTFTIEAFDHMDAGVSVVVGATAAQAFTGVETIAASKWGVWTLQITGAQVITTKAPMAAMAYDSAAEALAAAPKPDASNGLVGVMVMGIGAGGPFTAGTTNTDNAMVDSIATTSRWGHTIAAGILATQSNLQATKDTRLKVLNIGNLVGEIGDSIVVTVRSAGNATFSNGIATVVYRKTPAQGDGYELGTGRSTPFVP